MFATICIPRKFSSRALDSSESPAGKYVKDGKSWSSFSAICSLCFAISMPDMRLLKICNSKVQG